MYKMVNLGQMFLKGVNWVHQDKIRSNGLERSQLGTQYKENHGLGSKNEVWKNQFIFKLKRYTESAKTWIWAENHGF